MKGKFVDHPNVKSFGKHSYMGAGWQVLGGNRIMIEIGKYCSLAGNIRFNCYGDHNWKVVSTFPLRCRLGIRKGAPGGDLSIYKGNIVLGNDVWVGNRATFMQGAKVGDGCIIGAEAVVAGDIPPYSIVVGNPGKVAKRRFTDAQIDALLKIAWWDWPEDHIRERIADFCHEDIDLFIRKYS